MSPSPIHGLLTLIRPEVRSEKQYVVGGARDVATKLNQNESPYDLPAELKREILDEVFQIPMNRYPAEQPEKLTAALAEQLEKPVESLIIGNGSNELTYTLGLCLIAPGSKVVVPRPMFALYESMIRMFGGEVISVAPRDDLQFDADRLLARVKAQQPVMTVLTTPNNPTGLAMKFEDVRRIVDAADGFVIVDEAYHEFNSEPSALSLMDEHPNVIVMRTLSKALGLAGLRLGYLCAHPDVSTELMKSRLPFMVDRFSEYVGLTVLRNRELVEERVNHILRNTAWVTDALLGLDGVEVLPSQTNFVLFKTGHDPAHMLNTLADSGVLVRNMSGYPELSGFLRVTSGTERENKVFLTALKAAL